jgi:hypothetical protein
MTGLVITGTTRLVLRVSESTSEQLQVTEDAAALLTLQQGQFANCRAGLDFLRALELDPQRRCWHLHHLRLAMLVFMIN